VFPQRRLELRYSMGLLTTFFLILVRYVRNHFPIFARRLTVI
jgi:hypothetical protein